MTPHKLNDYYHRLLSPTALFRHAKSIVTNRTKLSAAIALAGYGFMAGYDYLTTGDYGASSLTREGLAGAASVATLVLAMSRGDAVMPFVAGASIAISALRDAPQLVALQGNSWGMLAIGIVASLPMMCGPLRDFAWNKYHQLAAEKDHAPAGILDKLCLAVTVPIYREFSDPKFWYAGLWTVSHLLAVTPHYDELSVAKKIGLMTVVGANLIYIGADRPVRRGFARLSAWLTSRKPVTEQALSAIEALTPPQEAARNHDTITRPDDFYRAIICYEPITAHANDNLSGPPGGGVAVRRQGTQQLRLPQP
jgi:hypothetical protein